MPPENITCDYIEIVDECVYATRVIKKFNPKFLKMRKDSERYLTDANAVYKFSTDELCDY